MKVVHWDKEMITTLHDMLEKVESVRSIAKKIGVHPESVRRYCQLNGIIIPPRPRNTRKIASVRNRVLDESTTATLHDMLEKRCALYRIAEKIDMHKDTLQRYCRKHDITIQPAIRASRRWYASVKDRKVVWERQTA